MLTFPGRLYIVKPESVMPVRVEVRMDILGALLYGAFPDAEPAKKNRPASFHFAGAT
jgi:hypothetical protein